MDCFELLRKQTDVVLEAPDLADLFDALVIRVRLHVSPADPAHSPLTLSLTAHACDVRATLRQANAFLSQQWRPAMPSATISLVCRCARCPVVTLTTDQCCHRFFVSLSLSLARSLVHACARLAVSRYVDSHPFCRRQRRQGCSYGCVFGVGVLRSRCPQPEFIVCNGSARLWKRCRASAGAIRCAWTRAPASSTSLAAGRATYVGATRACAWDEDVTSHHCYSVDGFILDAFSDQPVCPAHVSLAG